jgi:GNAT superfamily N-acetyltransferase
MRIIQLNPAHLQQMLDLLQSDNNGIEQFQQLAGFRLDEETLTRQLWDDPDYEPELVSGAFQADKLIGFSLAVRRPWKSGRETTGFIKWIYVTPRLRGNGIGSQLLHKTEIEMKSQGIKELFYGSAAPRYFLPGVAAEDRATQALLDKHEWKSGSERINLSLPLTDELPSPPRDPQDITTGLITEADRNNLKSFITTEFSESWWMEIESVFHPAEKAFGITAHHKSKIAGFAAVHATNPNWFGPMGVSKTMQGRGIGRLLLLKALNEATAKATEHLTIPWANEPFYNKCLGKLPRRVFIKYSKNISPTFIQKTRLNTNLHRG